MFASSELECRTCGNHRISHQCTCRLGLQPHAMMAGITFDDIHKAAGGNVQTYIAKAANHIAERDAQLGDASEGP